MTLMYNKSLIKGFETDRFKQVISVITKNEENWFQSTWHLTLLSTSYDVEATSVELDENLNIVKGCGTAHCFAGWCDILSGEYNKRFASYMDTTAELSGRKVTMDEWVGTQDSYEMAAVSALYWLQLEAYEGDAVFRGSNTIKDICRAYYKIILGRLQNTYADLMMSAGTSYEGIIPQHIKDDVLEVNCCEAHTYAELAWLMDTAGEDDPSILMEGPHEELPHETDNMTFKSAFHYYSDEEVAAVAGRGDKSFSTFGAKIELARRSSATK
jgi:hypothetical protein